ncbi:MAG: FMN-binding protein [Planctomycetaceae bacterium]
MTIVLAIHHRHERHVADERGRREITASIAQVRELLAGAQAFGPSDPQRGGRFVVDADGETVGYVVQTLPAAKNVVGYSGPNDLLLTFGADGRLAGLSLLTSGDTPDHVALVRQDATFLSSFAGSTWSQLASLDHVDGVTGATLTSAAIAEAVVHRLAGSQPSFRFPESLDVSAAEAFFPEAASIEPDRRGVWRVLDDRGSTLGLLLRTSPMSDDRIGYQGPTDGLLALDPAGETVVGIGFQRSYDTPRYVEDVSLDWTFLHGFDGMPLAGFSALTVGHGADVEGVSGATMTSQTLVENLVEAATRFQSKLASNRTAATGAGATAWNFDFESRDLGTAAVVLFATVIAFTNLRGKTWLRRVWQVVLIVYLGFVNADLLSQGLLVGWAQNGPAWRIAPGLVLLAVAAFAVPLTTRTQLYCHHLCPHGAAQELLRNRLPWRVHLPRRLERLLSLVPAALLALVVVVALWHLRLDLTGIEPFDAYSLAAAGTATLVIAVGGLIASLFVPMAYCRYGCPTGALLGYLRRNGRSDRLTVRDALAAGLAVLAGAVAWL